MENVDQYFFFNSIQFTSVYFWVKNEQENTLSLAFNFFVKYHKEIVDRTKVIKTLLR